MADEKPDIGLLVDEAAKAIGLPIAPQYRANVIVNSERPMLIAAPCSRSSSTTSSRPRRYSGHGRSALQAATASGIARALMSGKVKAAAVIEAALTRIETSEPTVNAFTDVVAARARKRAAEIDAGTHRGPLAGVPFAVKNLFDIKGLPTRAGSKINVDGPMATRDGSLVRKLEASGAILVGGLDMGEYAYDFTGENTHYGPPRNPRDTTRMTGGSSAARARRWRRARCRCRWVPTPTARSACRPRCAACSG